MRNPMFQSKEETSIWVVNEIRSKKYIVKSKVGELFCKRIFFILLLVLPENLPRKTDSPLYNDNKRTSFKKIAS